MGMDGKGLPIESEFSRCPHNQVNLDCEMFGDGDSGLYTNLLLLARNPYLTSRSWRRHMEILKEMVMEESPS